MASRGSGTRPAPDAALAAMADYVRDYEVTSPEAWRMAHSLKKG